VADQDHQLQTLVTCDSALNLYVEIKKQYYDKPWFAERKLYGLSYFDAKRKYMFAFSISLKASIA